MHVAVIMDGNGRWALRRGKPRYRGHLAGVRAFKTLIESALEEPVKHLTVFAFSSENIKRPYEEIRFLKHLFAKHLEEQLNTLHTRQVCLRFVGDLDYFGVDLRTRIEAAEALTQHNTGLILTVALNYGGRWDVLQAVRRVCARVLSGAVTVEALSEACLSQELATAGMPDPDLLIRTGGELRISNFMNWQLSYTELYFTPILWPDFDRAAWVAALDNYRGRIRRFGSVVEATQRLEVWDASLRETLHG
jgi:undecaprenyl diphosphate synthase